MKIKQICFLKLHYLDLKFVLFAILKWQLERVLMLYQAKSIRFSWVYIPNQA